MAHDVFGDDARHQELEQIIFAAGLGAAAGHLESAEGMAAHHRAGARAIDVDVARDDLGLGALDVGGTAREKSGGEREIGAVGDCDRFVEIAHFDHAQDRAENFFASDAHVRTDVA